MSVNNDASLGYEVVSKAFEQKPSAESLSDLVSFVDKHINFLSTSLLQSFVLVAQDPQRHQYTSKLSETRQKVVAKAITRLQTGELITSDSLDIPRKEEIPSKKGGSFNTDPTENFLQKVMPTYRKELTLIETAARKIETSASLGEIESLIDLGLRNSRPGRVLPQYLG